MLADLGFEVYEAGHGEEARSVLGALGPVELVILDWNMPVMDGLEFLKMLRADRAYDQVLVVMATGNSDVSSIGTALEAGASEYVMKPFTAEDLVSKLSMLGFEFPGSPA
jgi:two-component system chemotaxis response regulator CheY